jgi:hypothetical protein
MKWRMGRDGANGASTALRTELIDRNDTSYAALAADVDVERDAMMTVRLLRQQTQTSPLRDDVSRAAPSAAESLHVMTSED